MSNRDDESQHQFKRELSQLIRKYATGLQTSEFADTLGEFHSDLTQGSLEPEVEITDEQEPWGLRVMYSTGVSLEEHLEDYLEVGGVCLKVDRELPPLADVVLEVTGSHIDASVKFRARAVQKTPAGVAFQVTPPSEDIDRTLRAMPDKIRAGAAKKLGARAQEPAASSQTEAQAPGEQPEVRSEPPRSSQPLELDGEPAVRWQLDNTPLPEILCELLEHDGLGVVDIDLGTRRAQLVLDGAKVLDVEIYPRAPNESLEKLLAAAGRLDGAQIRQAREYAGRHGVNVAEALVDLEFLTYAELGVALKTRARFLLGVLWDKDAGEATLYETDELSRRFRAPASPLAYHVFRRFRDAFSRADDEWLDERRGFFRAHLISRADSPLCDFDALELGGQDARLYQLVLDDERPLSDIFRIARLNEREVLTLLEAWRRLGMLELEQVNPFTRRRTRFIEQIERMQARVGRGNHFELLGVHWTAHQDEIEQAYRERLESLEDERLPDQLDAATTQKIAALQEALEQAYAQIKDRKRRASYRDSVVDDFEKRNALEMFEKQADTAKLRRDLDAAIDAYLRVLELDPHHEQANRDLEVLRKLRAAERR